MLCPKCGGDNIRVIRTDKHCNDSIKRRRICDDCDKVWYTMECRYDPIDPPNPAEFYQPQGK